MDVTQEPWTSALKLEAGEEVIGSSRALHHYVWFGKSIRTEEKGWPESPGRLSRRVSDGRVVLTTRRLLFVASNPGTGSFSLEVDVPHDKVFDLSLLRGRTVVGSGMGNIELELDPSGGGGLDDFRKSLESAVGRALPEPTPASPDLK